MLIEQILIAEVVVLVGHAPVARRLVVRPLTGRVLAAADRVVSQHVVLLDARQHLAVEHGGAGAQPKVRAGEPRGAPFGGQSRHVLALVGRPLTFTAILVWLGLLALLLGLLGLLAIRCGLLRQLARALLLLVRALDTASLGARNAREPSFLRQRCARPALSRESRGPVGRGIGHEARVRRIPHQHGRRCVARLERGRIRLDATELTVDRIRGDGAAGAAVLDQARIAQDRAAGAPSARLVVEGTYGLTLSARLSLESAAIGHACPGDITRDMGAINGWVGSGHLG